MSQPCGRRQPLESSFAPILLGLLERHRVRGGAAASKIDREARLVMRALDHTTGAVTNPFTRPSSSRRGAAVLDGEARHRARESRLASTIRSGRRGRCSRRAGAVAAVHRDYLDAGADVIETATYQATPAAPRLPSPRRGCARPAGSGTRSGSARAGANGPGRSSRRRSEATVPRLANGGRVSAATTGSMPTRWPHGTGRGFACSKTPEPTSWRSRRSPRSVEAEAIAPTSRRRATVRFTWVSFQARDGERVADGPASKRGRGRRSQPARVRRRGQLRRAGARDAAPRALRRGDVEASRRLPESRGCLGSRDEALDRSSGGTSTSIVSFPSGSTSGARLIGGCCRTTPPTSASSPLRFRGHSPFLQLLSEGTFLSVGAKAVSGELCQKGNMSPPMHLVKRECPARQCGSRWRCWYASATASARSSSSSRP